MRTPAVLRVPTLATAVLLLFGCAAAPSTGVFQRFVNIQASRSPVQVDASATVEVSVDMGRELSAFWRGAGGGGMLEPARSLNYMQVLGGKLGRAVEESGAFARFVPAGAGSADFLVKVKFEYSLAATSNPNVRDIRVKLAFTCTDVAKGQEICSNTAEGAIGVACYGRNGIQFQAARFGSVDGYTAMVRGTESAVTAMLPHLEGSLAGAVRNYQQEPARKKALAELRAASLPDLLVSADSSVQFARERNRAIVAAKVGQLPGILREWKTDQLTALVIKLEQTILDLNHESEVAKDRAERAAATNEGGPQVDEWRGLAISYRERIELLKAILAPVKEEVANRSR